MTDSRPDLAYDSQDWTRLLTLAENINLELSGILHGMRCCGLRLHRGGQGWALRPELDPETSKWTTKAEYMADRDKWLMPYGDEIVALLNRL
jgi:hypothetical protein